MNYDSSKRVKLYFCSPMNRIHQPRLLLIAGNHRNVGKTHLAVDLIRKYAGVCPVIGLKASAMYPGDSHLHGNHSDETPQTYSIIEETERNGRKDTSRFLQAGAQRAVFIRAQDAWLADGFESFLNTVYPGTLIICESRSLVRLVKPGILVLIKKTFIGGQPLKDVSDIEPLADIVVESGLNKYEGGQVLSAIGLNASGWICKQPLRFVYP